MSLLRRRHFLAGAVALVGCDRGATPSPSATTTATTASAPALRTLGAGFAPLHDDFDATLALVRVLALLSPT